MSRRRPSRVAVVLVVAAVVVIVLPLVGCASAIKGIVGNKGEIDVSVTDASTGSPVAGATVTNGAVSVPTDASGNAVLQNLKISTQEITVSKEGYVSQTNTVKLSLSSFKQDLTVQLKKN